jgi:hypothetical protein
MYLFSYLRYLYWDWFLGGLYGSISPVFEGVTENEWIEPGFKIGATVVLLFLLREIYVRVQLALTRRRLWKSMEGHDVREPGTAKDTSFIEEIDAAQYPVHTLGQLKKEKRYGRIGEILAKLNQPEEAARWFLKDKQYERAAGELARAGKTIKAARLLKRAGDYETASRFYAAAGKPKQAAAMCVKRGDVPGAAAAYIEGGYYEKGVAVFNEYFTATTDPPEKQLEVADRCYQLLQQYNFSNALQVLQRNAMLNAVAQRFRAAGRTALAARVFQEAGDTLHASEMYKMNSDNTTPQKNAPAQKNAEREGAE